MSHPEIIDNCKKVTIQYLLDAIGKGNIVSIILYGSVARNEESYKYVNRKLFLESDIDIMVVVKNRIVVVKSWLRLKSLCDMISDELRKNWSLSFVTISITTENRLLRANPDDFYLHLKLNGKVIFGKELISLMPNYGYLEYKNIPLAQLKMTVFGHMMNVVRSVALSGIIEEKITVNGYNSVLKSIRKLILFMIRTIIIKDSIPLNPYDLNEIKTKRSLYQTKNSAMLHDLLDSYHEIKLSDSKEHCSMAEIEKCLVRLIKQFNSIIVILTGVENPLVTLPKKLICGRQPFIQRLEYSMYLLLTNIHISWSIGLFKFIIFTLLRPEDITFRLYDLFISSPDLIKSLGEGSSGNNQQRQSWVKRYSKTLHPWEYEVLDNIIDLNVK
jgi:predicted nucleotidyltransferase